MSNDSNPFVTRKARVPKPPKLDGPLIDCHTDAPRSADLPGTVDCGTVGISTNGNPVRWVQTPGHEARAAQLAVYQNGDWQYTTYGYPLAAIVADGQWNLTEKVTRPDPDTRD